MHESYLPDHKKGFAGLSTDEFGRLRSKCTSRNEPLRFKENSLPWFYKNIEFKEWELPRVNSIVCCLRAHVDARANAGACFAKFEDSEWIINCKYEFTLFEPVWYFPIPLAPGFSRRLTCFSLLSSFKPKFACACHYTERNVTWFSKQCCNSGRQETMAGYEEGLRASSGGWLSLYWGSGRVWCFEFKQVESNGTKEWKHKVQVVWGPLVFLLWRHGRIDCGLGRAFFGFCKNKVHFAFVQTSVFNFDHNFILLDIWS